jgi:hypothetical protein
VGILRELLGHIWFFRTTIRYGSCAGEEIEGVQKLLGDRQISPFSVDFSGNTLLHMRSSKLKNTENMLTSLQYSTWEHKADICIFFFEMGLTGEETNVAVDY